MVNELEQQARYAWSSHGGTTSAHIFNCTWNFQEIPTTADSTKYSVVDLLIDVKREIAPAEANETLSRSNHPKLCGLFDAIIGKERNAPDFSVAVKILLPSFDGYFIRENIIDDRFIDSQAVSTIHRLAQWTEKTRAASPQALMGQKLTNAVSSAATALIGHKYRSTDTTPKCLDIENELHCRLQLQWWQRELPPIRRLALVSASKTWKFFRPVYEAAKANRINLVIIDEPDHWLNKSENSHLREHFLPMSLRNDDGKLPFRMAEVIRSSGVVLDGLTSHYDHTIAPVAQAAEILGFTTQPSTSYYLCRDKHATHRLRTASLLNQLVTTEEQAVALAEDPSIQYPLVVKPQSGFKSEGVTKITEPSQILPAVRTVLSEIHDLAVVETYIDGPEIDANMVICDGRLLFCEMADNSPCLGDDDAADPTASLMRPGNFSETGITSPSALPEDELKMAQASAFDAVIAAGYTSGSFHVEGRIMNSKMRYERVEGKVDLLPVPDAPAQAATFVLIEINARPPGLPISVAAKRAFGVDHYEHLMFMALNDHDRMRALARPFAFPGLQGAQYWSHIQFPLVLYSGDFDGTAWMSMIESNPKAFQYISAFESLWADGQAMPDPMEGRSRALAFFVMYARESRQRLLEIVEDVQQQLHPSLVTGLIQTVGAKVK